jgi:dihydropteroate synthase
MGVLNVTPDSFSDGGRYADLDAAVAHGLAMSAAGADIVDVGGESTRPGAERVDADEETRRVAPTIHALARSGVTVSVDTTRAAVAEAALDAGARIVNDVSGGLADPAMAKTIAAAGVPLVLMHWRAHSRDMQALARYDDVVADVKTELARQVDAALAAGVDAANIVLDPGLGFAKTAAHNWALLARLDELTALGFPVLVGASRKAFLGRLLAGPDGTPAPVDAREHATAATSVLAAVMGAWGVRVHEVAPSRDALKVVSAWSKAAEHPAADADPAGPPGPRPRGWKHG